MAKEIERKFLLANEDWRQQVSRSVRMRQGYIAPMERSSVRVRIEGENANINIKSAVIGIERLEYEYPIPLSDAEEMLNSFCSGPQVNKVRHYVHYKTHEWEVDEFLGDNMGLIVAEVELGDIYEAFEIPDWAGQEVSDDPRYYNVNLAKNPYTSW